jgi:hypothetical protein
MQFKNIIPRRTLKYHQIAKGFHGTTATNKHTYIIICILKTHLF